MEMNLINKLRFVTPALVTPMRKDGSFDEKGMESLVKYVLGCGMKTLFVLGYAGECLAFGRRDRRRIIEVARRAAGEEVLLMAGTMDDSTALIEEHIRDACDCGADIALTTPTNFYHCSDAELRALFFRLNETTKLPIVIYNCPETIHYIKPQLINELARLDNIVGLKQTSDLMQVQDMVLGLEPRDDFVLLAGHEYVYYPAMTLGVQGFIMGGPGNILPKQCIQIFNDYMGGNVTAARDGHLRMVKYLKELYGVKDYTSAVPQCKAILEMAGICERWMAHPIESVSDEDMGSIRTIVKRHNMAIW